MSSVVGEPSVSGQPQAGGPRRAEFWREALLVLALLVLALGLRFFNLTGESLWYDETYSVWIADMDIASLRILWEMPVQFPAYYLLLHAWVRTFGLSDLSVRAVGALLGALTVVPMYLLGRTLFGHRVGVIGAFLLAINPYHIWYSQEVRMHSWAVLFTLISLYAFWRLLNKGRWGWWAVHMLFTALTFHLHYYIGFMIVAQNLYLLGHLWREHGGPFNRAAWRTLRWWLADQALLLLVMVPGIIVFLVKLLELREWDWLAQSHGPPGVSALISLFADYTLGSDFPAGRAVVWGALALVGLLAAWGVLVGLWPGVAALSIARRPGQAVHAVWKPRLRRTACEESRGRPGVAAPSIARRQVALVLVALGAPLAMMFIAGQFFTVWVTRYLLPFLPLYLLLVALGIGALPRKTWWAPLLVFALLSGVALERMYTTQQKEDWRGVAAYLAPRVVEDDLIVIMDADCRVPFTHYYGSGGRRVEISRFADDAALDKALAEMARKDRGGRLWVVVSHADAALLEAKLAALPLTPVAAPEFVGVRLIELEPETD